MSELLQWECDLCGKEIEDGEGHITIIESEVAEAQTKMEQWKQAHPADASGITAYSLGDILEQPSNVRWHAYHASCDPEPEGSGYTIAVSRIRSCRAALAWSLHLLGSKDWVVHYTDWAEFMRSRADVSIPG